MTDTNTKDPADTRSLGEQLWPEQYKRRDAECRAFVVDGKYQERCNAMEVARLHDAFNAGWAARKLAELEHVLGIRKHD